MYGYPAGKTVAGTNDCRWGCAVGEVGNVKIFLLSAGTGRIFLDGKGIVHRVSRKGIVCEQTRGDLGGTNDDG